MISPIERLIGLAALAAAVSVRPWRLLELDSPYELWAPLILLGVAALDVAVVPGHRGVPLRSEGNDCRHQIQARAL